MYTIIDLKCSGGICGYASLNRGAVFLKQQNWNVEDEKILKLKRI